MVEAGASSGLPRRAVHALDRPAAHRRDRERRPDRPLRPADAGRGADRVARRHRARRRLRRRARCARSAVRDGDEYVVDGAKTFITSGGRADFVTTAVRTGGPGARGVSLLVVERGTPGFTVTRRLAKMGWLCSDTAELGYAGVRVPAANLVGEENGGFGLVMRQFVGERLALAAHAYAVAARSLALTRAWTRTGRRSAPRWPPGRRSCTGWSRCTSASSWPARTRGR